MKHFAASQRNCGWKITLRTQLTFLELIHQHLHESLCSAHWLCFSFVGGRDDCFANTSSSSVHPLDGHPNILSCKLDFHSIYNTKKNDFLCVLERNFIFQLLKQCHSTNRINFRQNLSSARAFVARTLSGFHELDPD